MNVDELSLEDLEVVADEFDTLSRSSHTGVCRWAGWWKLRLESVIDARADAAESAVTGLPTVRQELELPETVGLDTLSEPELLATQERFERCLGNDDRPGVRRFGLTIAEAVAAELFRREWARLRLRAESDAVLAAAQPEWPESPTDGIPSWAEASGSADSGNKG